MSFDFLESWLEWGDPLPAPRILRLWSGIAAISAIVNRRIWIKANSRLPPLYPSIFIMLVAPPRVGKDLAVNSAAALCNTANKRALKRHGSPIIHFGSKHISPKGLIDELAGNKLSVSFSDKNHADLHSTCYFIPEATTAIPEYNKLLIGFLNELWNCNPDFKEKVRGVEHSIDNPHIMLLFGNQPDTLYEVFPESTFKMGFTARVFFVYATERIAKKVHLEEHEEAALNNSLYDKLVNHLITLSQWSGKLETTRGFRDAVNDFENRNPSIVPGERFKHWNGARCINLQKLSMCIAASEATQIITEHHWGRAIEYLFEIEKVMPSIFDNVTTDRGYSEDMERIQKLVQEAGTISQFALTKYLARTKPPHEVGVIIRQLEQSGLLAPVFDEGGAPLKPLRYTLGKPGKAGHTLQ